MNRCCRHCGDDTMTCRGCAEAAIATLRARLAAAEGLLRSMVKRSEALEVLNAAYRVGTRRTPEKALRDLDATEATVKEVGDWLAAFRATKAGT